MEAGADDYLTKPFEADALQTALRTGKRILDLQSKLLDTQKVLQFEATHDALTGSVQPGTDSEYVGARTAAGRTREKAAQCGKGGALA